jgi:hypothetical protein
MARGALSKNGLGMLADAVARAREKLEKAKSHATGLTASNDYRSAHQSWHSFLATSNRVFTLLEQGAKSSNASKNWFSSHKHLRRTDPLLSSVHHARNADENGIASITGKNQC